jgi:hypothetical protein
MFDGNIFLPVTGMPILKRARKIVRFDVWLPEPFAVPTVIEKSLIILFVITSSIETRD